MTATRTLARSSCKALALLVAVLGASLTHAEVRLSDNWPSSFTADGRLLPEEKDEGSHLRRSAEKFAETLTAVPPGEAGRPEFNGGFRLHLDGALFYVQPSYFVARDKPGEVCTMAPFEHAPTYQCKEGQRYANSCHLLFLNKDMEPAGSLRLHVDEPYRYFCNAMPALGVGDKSRNELLVTVQYFAIDHKPAASVKEVGSGWQRMTMAVRVKAVDGKIVAEQDDVCLHNPNKIDNVPAARKALQRCHASGH